MRSNITRRGFLAATTAASAFVALARPVLALTEAGARALINTVVTEINRVISSGKSEAAMIRDFETIFVRYGDVPIMAQYVLGNDGRRATAAQKRAFQEAFQGYISRKYGKRFREFIGGKIEVEKARQINAGYEIISTAYLRGEAPFEVTFLVSDKSGRDLFFNLFIEGVNVLLTERTEIGAMLDRRGGDIDQMIADLRRAG
ncbi:MlaC/ttg2D family ABC transporter substrate-binding protein [Sulfitobacter sabulilitoris]|uniref:ABC transporter substrate-binding protein n=1 Tax=Sulfitobacter sabulilitoris TaxID=2562655 RepID=A0A5S3PFF6_9RHOB|nr:ABC transporter substrate-binding protein [Sulfitobacter sabulilitoris]TMM52777.1 ABC transporter substrate-binding protein [Sulfitobacter sabulilitoris]